MKTLYIIETNADREVIEIDHDERMARILSTSEVQDWESADDLKTVEDTSSWEAFDYEIGIKIIEACDQCGIADCPEILATIEWEG